MYIEYIEKIMFKRGLKRNVIKNKLYKLYTYIEWKLIEISLSTKIKQFNLNIKQINNFLLYIGFTILSQYKLTEYDINSYITSII